MVDYCLEVSSAWQGGASQKSLDCDILNGSHVKMILLNTQRNTQCLTPMWSTHRQLKKGPKRRPMNAPIKRYPPHDVRILFNDPLQISFRHPVGFTMNHSIHEGMVIVLPFIMVFRHISFHKSYGFLRYRYGSFFVAFAMYKYKWDF